MTTSYENQDQGLVLDESAIKRLGILEKEQGRKLSLRLCVDSGGCAGFQYQFSLEAHKEPEPGEHLFKAGDACLIVDDVSLGLLNGSHIAYEEEMIGASFVVKDNPQAISSCGCKVSFSAFKI